MKNAFHEVLYVRTQQYPGRLFPLILLENGQPGYAINAFINYLLMQGVQESSLQQKIQAVCQLYEFCRRSHGYSRLSEEELRTLIYRFGRAKLHGTIQSDGCDPLCLYWRPVHPRTLKTILRNIDDFDRFQTVFFHADRLNPAEVHFQSAFERYIEFKSRSNYDPFIHLFPSRSNEVHQSQYQILEHRRDSLKRRAEKVFPAEFIVDLIEKTPEPRDKMLLLLMAFGGLRRSEPLHLLHQDVVGRFRDTGAAWITLGDPVRGAMDWQGVDGRERHGTRSEFFLQEYSNQQLPIGHPLRNLQPRSRYGKGDRGLYVGFKGMTFSGHGNNNFVHWLHEEAGILFWKSYEEYLARHFYGKPKHWPYHPFLFIRLDADGYGMPLTLPAVDKVFARASERIGLYGFSPHALRHFYGYYLASVLRRPIEEAQVCLHHASVLSTQTYYRTAPETIRREILLAAYQATGRPVPLAVNESGIVNLAIPKSWGNIHDDVLFATYTQKQRPDK